MLSLTLLQRNRILFEVGARDRHTQRRAGLEKNSPAGWRGRRARGIVSTVSIADCQRRCLTWRPVRNDQKTKSVATWRLIPSLTKVRDARRRALVAPVGPRLRRSQRLGIEVGSSRGIRIGVHVCRTNPAGGDKTRVTVRHARRPIS
jgi:hypothetical protein